MGVLFVKWKEREQDAAVILDLRVDWGFSHPQLPLAPQSGQEGKRIMSSLHSVDLVSAVGLFLFISLRWLLP